MENENYAQAVEDIAACLAKRIKALPSDSRCHLLGPEPSSWSLVSGPGLVLIWS